MEEKFYYSVMFSTRVWVPGKLKAAVDAIKREASFLSTTKPILYTCNLYITDTSLNVIRKTHREKRINSMESWLLRGSLGGNTMVMNSELRNIVNSAFASIGTNILGHDFLAQILSLAFGGVLILDPEAYIYYRQHGSNEAGSPSTLIPRIRKECLEMRKYKNTVSSLAQTIINNCGE